MLGAAALGVGSLAAWYFIANPEVDEGLSVACGNIGGLLSGFDEYVGDYGSINPTKEQVSDLITGKSTGLKPQTAENIAADVSYGPTLGKLITNDDFGAIMALGVANGFNEKNLSAVWPFIMKYQDTQIFYALRRLPSCLLSIDKNLRDAAKETPEGFTLGILSSQAPMVDEETLSKQLLTPDVLARAENDTEMSKKIKKWTEEKPKLVTAALDGLQRCLGTRGTASLEDLEPFKTPEGQVFLYLIYQRMNTRILAQKAGMIEAVNKAKKSFAASALGNPALRAQIFLSQLKDSAVFFTQECDLAVRNAFTAGGFLSTEKQISSDGSFIFLNKKHWEPKYKVLSSDENDAEGKCTRIIAKRKDVDERAYLASLHGSAKNAGHAREYISAIHADFVERSKKDPTLKQLIIGVDANSNTPKDEKALLDLLEDLGLHAAEIAITTTKERDVTIQHDKTAEKVVARKDYIITLKSHAFKDLKVAFKKEPLSENMKLPTIDMPSDHATLQARLVTIRV
jgi:hypothetical protein